MISRYVELMYFLLGSRSLNSSFFVYYQIWQKTTSHSDLKKTQKYISAEHLLRSRGHKFKQKKVRNTFTAWWFKFYEWRKIIFSNWRFFLPTCWSFSTDLDCLQKILEKANNPIPKRSFACISNWQDVLL